MGHGEDNQESLTHLLLDEVALPLDAPEADEDFVWDEQVLASMAATPEDLFDIYPELRERRKRYEDGLARKEERGRGAAVRRFGRRLQKETGDD